MSNLKFAILRFVGKPGAKEAQIALEIDQDELLEKLRSTVGRLLAVKETAFSKKHSREEVDIAVQVAFNSIVKEFKNQSIRIV